MSWKSKFRKLDMFRYMLEKRDDDKKGSNRSDGEFNVWHFSDNPVLRNSGSADRI